jgi:DNA-binding NarL/FixJ family response regulator
MSLPRVLIVDDHRVVVDGLVRLLHERVDIVAAITDGRLVLEAVTELQPDVVLLDISMPHISGLEAMQQMVRRGVPSHLLVLTMHADANLAVEALRAGASGFVLKESSGEELLKAIHQVLAGATYLPPTLTKEIVTLMAGATDPRGVTLTTTQREILRLIVRGHRAKEIASVLDMPTRTVEAIKYKTMQLLNVHSTAELVRYVIEHRLVTF